MSKKAEANADLLCCKHCCFYTSITSDRKGMCQRYPPHLSSNTQFLHQFPTVYETTWCGEWQAAEPPVRK